MDQFRTDQLSGETLFPELGWLCRRVASNLRCPRRNLDRGASWARVDESFEVFGGVAVAGGEPGPVDVEGRGGAGMTEPVGDGADVDAGGEARWRRSVVGRGCARCGARCGRGGVPIGA